MTKRRMVAVVGGNVGWRNLDSVEFLQIGEISEENLQENSEENKNIKGSTAIKESSQLTVEGKVS